MGDAADAQSAARVSRSVPRHARPHRLPTRRRRAPAFPTPLQTRTSPDRFVRARLRCSSRASLPLTPQVGTPAATIGMRPATSLRTKAKSVKGLLRAVGSPGFSYALRHCPRPSHSVDALSSRTSPRSRSGWATPTFPRPAFMTSAKAALRTAQLSRCTIDA